MKKWLSILLSASFAATAALPVLADNDEPFTDIDAAHWAYANVVEMVDAGYITGYGDGTFRPDNSVTRLEVLALFSRALGALDKVNEPILDMAVAKYGDIISEYGLGWGVEEIAFLMYRGVLSESDLDTYLKGSLKDEPMPRYESAIIITKAMGGEADPETEVSLDFSDADEIPSNATSYVDFVNENGIMTGMGDGKFSPMTSVLRSQMAVMLYRTCDITEYTFEKIKLTGIDVGGRLLSYKDDDGETQDVGYSKNVVMNVLGVATLPKQMTVGVDAIITKSGKTVAFVDTLADVPDAEVSGKYVSRATAGGITSITVKNSETGENETYPCAKNVSVTYDKSPASLTTFKANDYITLKLVGGEITTVIGQARSVQLANAVIEDISIDPDFTITISHSSEEYDGKTLEVSTEATVRKNGSTTDFSEVYPGDTVSLTLEYGVVQSVIATSASKIVEGVIESINIATRPSIDVKVNGKSDTYYVTNDVEILINNAEATLYDFRVGDTVKITLEGQAVAKISATAAQSTSGKIEGVITSVNQSYGFIKVSYTTASGYKADETVYCKDATTKVMTSMGATKKISNLQVGQTVIATGTTSNGAFSAKLIVISETD